MGFNKKNGFDFGLIGRLAQFLRKEKSDVVHTHNFPPLIYGSLAAKIAGRKCLNSRHGRAEQKTHSLIWKLNQFLVAVSHDARDEMIRHNAIEPEKVAESC